MSEKKLVLIIEANQGYIRNIKPDTDFSAQNEILFNAITETYIPLLNMMERLEEDRIDFKLGMVLSAPLCSLLSDPLIQAQYIEHLDKIIALGENELKRLKGKPELALAESYLQRFTQTKTDFIEKYQQNLVLKFKYYAKLEFLELIATAATYAYLPHFSSMDELLNAQVETGLYSQRYFFGDSGEGFWLPYLGWSKPMDRILRSYGINYTVVDARSLLFSEKSPENGIFTPVRCANSLVLFGADPDTEKEICGEEGFIHNEIYRSKHHDIGFEAKREDLSALIRKDGVRIQTGYKYWANSEEDDEEDFVLYDPESALKQAQTDAQKFYSLKLEKLEAAKDMVREEDVNLVCRIPAEILGQNWYEGIAFLEKVIRLCADEGEIKLAVCKDLIENQFKLPKTEPYPCSANGLGYGEDLLSNANNWMVRYIQKANSRMVDLAERFPSETSLKARLLNIGAKEILLAQSGSWPEMLNDGRLPEYVTEIFKKEILSFSKVFDSLASSTVSTEWLTNLEKEDAIFPWLNYKIFSRKK